MGVSASLHFLMFSSPKTTATVGEWRRRRREQSADRLDEREGTTTMHVRRKEGVLGLARQGKARQGKRREGNLVGRWMNSGPFFSLTMRKVSTFYVFLTSWTDGRTSKRTNEPKLGEVMIVE